MKGTDYNLATSILFVGYLLMQLPSNLLLTRVRPSLFLGIAMAIWYEIVGLPITDYQYLFSSQGCYFRLSGSHSVIFRAYRHPFLSWIRRGALLSRCRYVDVRVIFYTFRTFTHFYSRSSWYTRQEVFHSSLSWCLEVKADWAKVEPPHCLVLLGKLTGECLWRSHRSGRTG